MNDAGELVCPCPSCGAIFKVILPDIEKIIRQVIREQEGKSKRRTK